MLSGADRITAYLGEAQLEVVDHRRPRGNAHPHACAELGSRAGKDRRQNLKPAEASGWRFTASSAGLAGLADFAHLEPAWWRLGRLAAVPTFGQLLARAGVELLKKPRLSVEYLGALHLHVAPVSLN